MHRSLNDPAEKLYVIINPENLNDNENEEMTHFYHEATINHKEYIKNLQITNKKEQFRSKKRFRVLLYGNFTENNNHYGKYIKKLKMFQELK